MTGQGQEPLHSRKEVIMKTRFEIVLLFVLLVGAPLALSQSRGFALLFGQLNQIQIFEFLSSRNLVACFFLVYLL